MPKTFEECPACDYRAGKNFLCRYHEGVVDGRDEKQKRISELEEWPKELAKVTALGDNATAKETADFIADLTNKLVELEAELWGTERLPLLQWAVERWNAEVANRPLQNIHRRSLDDTWRQVMRYAGGDPDELVGPSHDSLAASGKEPNDKA